jgi:hypothetical protein
MERIFEAYRLTDERKESRTDNSRFAKAGGRASMTVRC